MPAQGNHIGLPLHGSVSSNFPTKTSTTKRMGKIPRPSSLAQAETGKTPEQPKDAPPKAGQSEALDWIVPAFGRIKAGVAGNLRKFPLKLFHGGF